MIRPSKITKISAVAVMMIGLALFSGCEQVMAPDLKTPGIPQTSEHFAYMKVSATFSPSGVLGKSSTAASDKLVLLMASNSQDTLRDTLADPVNSNGSSDQTLTRDYAVQSQRSWSVSAEVVNQNGGVVQEGSATTGTLYAQDTANVSLNLASTTLGRVGTSTLIVVIPRNVLE